MNIPATLQAGDTWAWTDSLVDYPATTWTLKYTLYRYGQAPISITASASGTDHAVSVAVASTIGKAAGEWNWSAYVEKGSGGTLERYTIATGRVTMKTAALSATSSSDNRSVAQVMLANIEEAILRLTKREVDQLTVNGKSVTYKDLGKLLKDRATLKSEVLSEKAAERIAQGLDPGRRILTRFQ